MPSQNYILFAQAIIGRKQVVCDFDGHHRELCPIILGHSKGQETALTYQFGGGSTHGLPPGGQWRCLFLSRVENAQLRDGPWRAGDGHSQRQHCVDDVDLDVNPNSPYNPKRRT